MVGEKKSPRYVVVRQGLFQEFKNPGDAQDEAIRRAQEEDGTFLVLEYTECIGYAKYEPGVVWHSQGKATRG